MAGEHLHFVTGRLAEHALRPLVAQLSQQLGFAYTVDVLPITVAALMTPDWVARHARIPPQATRVILPGYCEGDLAPLQARTAARVERGPKDLRDLGEYLGASRRSMSPQAEPHIQILAEINHAPRRTLAEICQEARQLRDAGADLIDLGCDPGTVWTEVGSCVRALKAEGFRVSIDSLNPAEIEPAVRAGAELVLSVNRTNRQAARDWGCEVVVIPDDPKTLAGLDETVEMLAAAGVPLRIDPILEPIGCGFAASLGRYLEVRRRYPDAEMLMGIGNLTELTDADSAAINVLLLGFCEELGIRSVLTTQVINWARSAVRECDLARRLVAEAVRLGIPPKHLEPQLVLLRDPKVRRFGTPMLQALARQIKDPNYRIFAEDGQIHLVGAGLYLADRDPFLLFERLLHPGFGGAPDEHPPAQIDPSHAFYLGYEMAKAAIALTLGKEYRQDEALRWGYLTVEEESHRLRKSAAARKPATSPAPHQPLKHAAPAATDTSPAKALPPAVRPTPQTLKPVQHAGGERSAEVSRPPKAWPADSSSHAPPRRRRDLPLVIELDPVPDVAQALQKLTRRPYSLLLESTLTDERLGRYSFLTADPFAIVRFPVGTADPLGQLRQTLAAWLAEHRPDLPPFQGGAAGLLSYDLGRSLERLPAPRHDEFGLPAVALGLYDVVIAWDHAQGRAWLISHGFPAISLDARRKRARQRAAEFLHCLKEGEIVTKKTRQHNHFFGGFNDLPATCLAPQYPVEGLPGLTSNFTAQTYQAAIKRAIEYIHAGDIFQVNLAQRLLLPARGEALELYLRMRQANPAPFAGWFDLGSAQIVSASPERFLRVCEGRVEARPIKGTRPRLQRAEADLFAAEELLASSKDRAENVMIVDLLRNDLSRVCQPDSVKVTQLCGLESYAFVQHLVSAVEGTLEEGRDALDLVAAAFPGGSVTGAPKVRAMEIIAELEPTARGAYCGSLGYLGFDGTADWNILIRTVTCSRGWWQFPVGGGIVAGSQPDLEYAETWHKAQGLLRGMAFADGA
jgi:anthranilate/para-aminobenzoate synthase component I/dihydropteroate synthase